MTLWVSLMAASTPIWAFRLKYRWFHFWFCFISGSRCFALFLVEWTAAIMVFAHEQVVLGQTDIDLLEYPLGQGLLLQHHLRQRGLRVCALTYHSRREPQDPGRGSEVRHHVINSERSLRAVNI